MSRIRGKDTKPELIVRSLVHSMGYRFRLHRADLPGKPDLVLQRHRKIILVHGCFWHRHSCRRGRSMPATRASDWTTKFDTNRKRDTRVRRRLRALGWDVVVIWECQTKPTQLRHLERRLRHFLGNV